MGALEEQVAGDHYKGMKIQPMEFTVKNGWDPAAHTALKYLSRFRDKNGLQDLEKARHCLKLRATLLPFDNFVRRWAKQPIPMGRYIEENGYEGTQAVVLFKLELYVLNNHEVTYFDVLQTLDDLIHNEYPIGVLQ
jgi:hypothetical protein